MATRSCLQVGSPIEQTLAYNCATLYYIFIFRLLYASVMASLILWFMSCHNFYCYYYFLLQISRDDTVSCTYRCCLCQKPWSNWKSQCSNLSKNIFTIRGKYIKIKAWFFEQRVILQWKQRLCRVHKNICDSKFLLTAIFSFTKNNIEFFGRTAYNFAIK